jgi:serine/threonine protein kinase
VDALADLELLARLGAGGFGTVFKGMWMGLVVAVKVVSDYGGDNRMILRSAHEIAILTALSHPNIVQVCCHPHSCFHRQTFPRPACSAGVLVWLWFWSCRRSKACQYVGN